MAELFLSELSVTNAVVTRARIDVAWIEDSAWSLWWWSAPMAR